MRIHSSTETTVNALIDATHGINLTAREKYVYRETLFSLIRLAKAEQLVEIKRNVKMLTSIAGDEPKRGARGIKDTAKLR
jgi:hypothetical protein